MKASVPPIVIALLCAAVAPPAEADWLTLPSRYTHDGQTGERVTQYAQPAAAVAPAASNFRSSGFTHTRSSIQFNQSSDNYHRVEKWGDPIRPYGEWRFPYRPYSVPYPAWGAPFAGLGQGGFGYPPPYGGYPPGSGGPGSGGPGGTGLPNPYPPRPEGGYTVPPYYDGSYPRDRPRRSDEDFFYQPPGP